jgi:hypothetical protein
MMSGISALPCDSGDSATRLPRVRHGAAWCLAREAQANTTRRWRRRAWLLFVIFAAIVDSGCRPASDSARSAPGETPGALPQRRQDLSTRDRAEWRAVLRWSDTCESDFEATRASDDAGLVFYSISRGVSLVQVICAAGAYQPAFLLVLLDERTGNAEARVLMFDAYQSADGTSVEVVKSAELTGDAWVSSDGTALTLLSFSRQTRDCGVWTRYALEDGTPRPVEVRGRLPCPESPGPPVESDGRDPPAGWTMVAPAAR